MDSAGVVDKSASFPTGRTAVYRAFGAGDVLLYVGVAGNWGHRWSQHSLRSAFFAEVLRLEIEWLPSRAEALALEAELITQHQPLFNVRGGTQPTVSGGRAGDQSANDGLVGLFFHSISAGNEVEWQGRIVKELPSERYLVQLYDWMLGDPSLKKIVQISEMAAWRFYDSAEEWRDWYEHVYSPRQRNGIPR